MSKYTLQIPEAKSKQFIARETRLLEKENEMKKREEVLNTIQSCVGAPWCGGGQGENANMPTWLSLGP